MNYYDDIFFNLSYLLRSHRIRPPKFLNKNFSVDNLKKWPSVFSNEDYKKAMEDGSVETNPPTDEKAPVLNDKGEWIEPSTGKVIDPMTGKYKDTIFGVNKWLAIGIGVAGVVGLYYIFKSKK
jgi:hypothetical protein